MSKYVIVYFDDVDNIHIEYIEAHDYETAKRKFNILKPEFGIYQMYLKVR